MDVRLIIQVLVNLIDNAIKYTLPGSKICIRGIKKDGQAQISVADNGPGISDEVNRISLKCSTQAIIQSLTVIEVLALAFPFVVQLLKHTGELWC